MVQASVPDPVAEVLLAVPVQAVNCDPDPAAFNLLVLTLVQSVPKFESMAMVLPAIGLVLDVRAVP
jgi:hypothetical protein